MKNRYFALLTIVCILTTHHFLFGQAVHSEVARSSEKEVKVRISSSFGSVNIEKGGTDKIVEVFYRTKKNEDDPKLSMNYKLRGNIGDLRLEMHPKDSERDESGGVHVKADLNFKTDEWYIKLVEGIPLSISAELGAGKSDFDFSGLMLKDVSISTGASSSSIQFDEPNRSEMDELHIETGVSKFSANNLNNANFKRMTFEGGVGSYYLDFGGELNRSADVDVNVGLGVVTLVIPRSVGVRIRYEDSWLSNLSMDDEFVRKRKGIYESENYSDAKGRLNVYIESGLGSVKVRRSK